MTPLDKAIEAAGGVAKMAASIGLSPNVVSNWRGRGQVPAERCLAVEAATGGAVTRYDLRPDVFGKAPSKRARAA
jgi:DNA-binding transcriptional regulator YdaS (Cro superfamily)